MTERIHLLLALPGAILAAALSGPAGAATFHLGSRSELTFSVFEDHGAQAPFLGPNAGRLWSPPRDGVAVPAARRFNWSAARPFGDPVLRGQENVRQLARRVHFQRFRMIGINGAAPFPMAAFELGSKNRFLDDRLLINADVFRYRFGGYRLTLPGGRGLLPSLGMTSRTSGADIQAAYKLGAHDYAGLSASYAHGRRATLPSLASAYRQVTNVTSLQIAPTYEHIVPLAHGASLTFDAAAIYRSSVRVAKRPFALLDGNLPVAGFASSIRRIETTRFDAGVTYKSSARLSVTAFVRNITDVRPDRSATLTTRNVVSPSTVSAVLSEPRTFGLMLSARL